MQNYDNNLQPNLDCFKPRKQNRIDLKVLIVDDNDLNLQVITEFMDILGLSYKTAQSGYDAIKMLNEEEYDIVFMDIIMPEMDGITTTKHIRRGSLNKNVPIYALSASSMPEDLEKCRNVGGMNGHIAKPVKLQDITLALKDSNNDLKIGEIKQSDSHDYPIPQSSEPLNTDLGLSYLNGNKKTLSRITH